MKIKLVMDLQYGSTGKGLLAGWLADEWKPDGVITCNMPNAGHTYVDKYDNTMVHKVLPNGVVSPGLKYVFIGPGAVFDVQRLHEEIRTCMAMGYLAGALIIIHPNASVLNGTHAAFEKNALSKIGSTAQGSMAATVEKMGRQNMRTIAAGNRGDIELPGIVEVTSHDGWMRYLNDTTRMLAEGSQGFSLGINQRFYPFCTSRECTPRALLSNMGLPEIPAEVWGTLRTYPIRVAGTSGPCYPDQTELTWEEVGQKEEYTTVTKKVRRVFTFSRLQLEEALWHCRPDHLFLNFCNYMEPTDLGRLTDDINEIGKRYGTTIRLTGVGPSHKDVKTFDTGPTPSEFREKMAHSFNPTNADAG